MYREQEKMRTNNEGGLMRGGERDSPQVTSPFSLFFALARVYCLMIQTITKSAICLDKVPLPRSISCHLITGSAGSRQQRVWNRTCKSKPTTRQELPASSSYLGSLGGVVVGSWADRRGRRRSAAFLTWMSDAATYYCKPSVEQDMQIEAHNATTRLVPQIAFPHQWN